MMKLIRIHARAPRGPIEIYYDPNCLKMALEGHLGGAAYTFRRQKDDSFVAAVPTASKDCTFLYDEKEDFQVKNHSFGISHFIPAKNVSAGRPLEIEFYEPIPQI
jgi:hypothetical protein